MKKDTAAFATELMPSVWLCGQLPAAVAKGGLARPPFAQLGSPPPSKISTRLGLCGSTSARPKTSSNQGSDRRHICLPQVEAAEGHRSRNPRTALAVLLRTAQEPNR
jgi:hypothetical protein